MQSRTRTIVAVIFALASGVLYAADPGSGAIEVSSQILKGESVIVSRVLSPSAGWVSVHIVEDGKPGRLLGYAPVRAGENAFVWIKLDLTGISPGLVAVLRADAGRAGTFEHPGPDGPVISNGAAVIASFNLVGCRGEISCDPELPTPSTPSTWGNFGQ